MDKEFNIMSKPDMSGRKDLGVKRVPSAPTPKQSQNPTRTGDGAVKRKMKKIMKSAGMLDNC